MRFVTAEQLCRRFGVVRQVAYRRLGELVRQGLAWHQRGLAGQFGVYGSTDAGAELCKSELSGSKWSWRDYDHTLALVDLYTDLERLYPVRTERELLAELYAGGLPRGNRRHVPDGTVTVPAGGIVALELELTSKSRARLEQILRWYGRDRRYAHVWYYCPLGAMPRIEQLARGADWLLVRPWPPAADEIVCYDCGRPGSQCLCGGSSDG